jgi:phosphoglycolate phosphatase
MKNTLILWDIDGTILHSAGGGMRAMRSSLQAVFGITEPITDVEFAGRTDPWIVRRILRKFGLPESQENVDRYLNGYVSALPEHMRAAGARVLPGVETLLDAAESIEEVSQGLLTGNIRKGAETKLAFHGLWHHFPFGAFADDSEIRNELGPHALRRAREHSGVSFEPGRVWVIGDTPHDIACARAVGVRVLAVATGGTTASDHSAHAPDALMESLEDGEAFWRVIRG